MGTTQTRPRLVILLPGETLSTSKHILRTSEVTRWAADFDVDLTRS